MSKRIDIELTSNRGDGTWTWRAAGAKTPKGTLNGSILDAGAKTGDTLKVEAEFDLDGVEIMAPNLEITKYYRTGNANEWTGRRWARLTTKQVAAAIKRRRNVAAYQTTPTQTHKAQK